MKMAESSQNGYKTTVGKGEIAHNEQFLLFPLCFQKTFPADTGLYRHGLVWEWVNSTTQARLLTTLYKKSVENIVGKVENAVDQHFLLLPQCFLPFPKQILSSESH